MFFFSKILSLQTSVIWSPKRSDQSRRACYPLCSSSLASGDQDPLVCLLLGFGSFLSGLGQRVGPASLCPIPKRMFCHLWAKSMGIAAPFMFVLSSGTDNFLVFCPRRPRPSMSPASVQGIIVLIIDFFLSWAVNCFLVIAWGKDEWVLLQTYFSNCKNRWNWTTFKELPDWYFMDGFLFYVMWTKNLWTCATYNIPEAANNWERWISLGWSFQGNLLTQV